MNDYLKQKIIVFIILFSSIASAQTYWVKYGWQVFESAGDARSQSLGSALSTDGGGAISSLFNPASQNINAKHNLHYTHQSRLGGMVSSDLFGLPLKSFKRPLSLIIMYEGIDKIPDTRNMLLDFGLDGVPGTGDIGEGNGLIDEGERLDKEKLSFFSQKQTGFHLSTSWDKGVFSYGIALKSLFHNLSEFSSAGMGLDIGLITSLWNDGKVGFLIRDATTSWQVWNNGAVERFKPILILGFSHQHYFENQKIKLIGSADFKWDTNGSRNLLETFNTSNTHSMAGLNINYNERIALRLGKNQINVTTFGVGLSWSDISIDYAFIGEPINSGLGSTHLISLSMNSNLILKYIDKL